MASKSNSLTPQDLEDAVSKALGNMGMPNHVFMDPATVQAFNTVFTSKYPDNIYKSRFKGKLHGKLKIGKIDWPTADAAEAAFDTLERMGFFKHVPKE